MGEMTYGEPQKANSENEWGESVVAQHDEIGLIVTKDDWNWYVMGFGAEPGN